MTSLMIVGLWCAHPDARLRPSMKQAIQALNSEVSPPILQSKMPNVPYSTLPNFSMAEKNNYDPKGSLPKQPATESQEAIDACGFDPKLAPQLL
ncbi:hypothetical protein L1987_55181 [Smallanthus sonchifolius]|uniref:Uncharacterized protein n=3 Tax=Smallanthus sonchifolius TaxID=185202 RepID=A0ACB9E8W9_9ASTR|nr:hypothetical protein L1987_55173 [Smallanthus sonchifolius]KAI3755380.1 hypothetical protein L1987_55177 [Smallanthus sonchifolius]KAI3755384.1 hypothetical protein L1987_55181 [Smallanthus sonchifolius]